MEKPTETTTKARDSKKEVIIEPGDLLQYKYNCPKMKPGSHLLFSVDDSGIYNLTSKGLYQHEICPSNSLVLNLNSFLEEQPYLMVVHSFEEPEKFIFKHKISKICKTSNSTTFPGYVAYVMYKEQLWSTTCFETMELFQLTFKVIK